MSKMRGHRFKIRGGKCAEQFILKNGGGLECAARGGDGSRYNSRV